MIRQPAVAGQFYPGDKESLIAELKRLLPDVVIKKEATGVISPHAGYIYSGLPAGHLFSSINIPRVVVILGPNHRGTGALAALSPDDSWRTPLGVVPVEKKLSRLIQSYLPAVQEDRDAHRSEHSLEVQLPFLQYLRPDISIVPLCLGFGDYEGSEVTGKALATAITAFSEPVLILASSDMTHYESAESAKEKDCLALERALALDAKGLVSVCRNNRISMCGVIPSAVMIVASRLLGATSSELVAYTNSGEITGDRREVVGYASVRIW